MKISIETIFDEEEKSILDEIEFVERIELRKDWGLMKELQQSFQ